MSSLREEWIGPFSELGISRSQLMSMPESEFIEKCNFCRECGFAPNEDLKKAIEESLQDIKRPTIVKPVVQHSQNTPRSRPTSSRQSSSRTHSSRTEKTSPTASAERTSSRASHRSKIADLPPEPVAPKKEKEVKVKAPSQPKQAGKDSQKHIGKENAPQTTEKHHHHHLTKENKAESTKPKEEKREPVKPKEEKREPVKPKEEKREAVKPKEEKKAPVKPKEEKREKAPRAALSPKEEILEKAKSLKPEPADGVCIAFAFPDGKRIRRRFALNTKGSDVKTFIASQETMFTPDNKPIGFTLQQTLGPELKLNSSLESQGITKNTMFSVVFDD